jgi:nitroreductase
MSVMEFLEVVQRRRMVRNYAPDEPVDRAVIDSLVDLAIRAPSAGFSQGWHFLVLDSPDGVRAFWDACASAEEPDSWLLGMQSAPALILALSDKQVYLDRYAEPDKGWTDRDEARWPVPYWDVDTGMASLLIMLGAVDHGLASCFFGVPPAAHAAVRAAFGIPEGLGLVGVVSLGTARPDRRSASLRRGRRPVTQVRSFGRFSPDGSPE